MRNEFHQIWIAGSQIRDEFLKWVCSESNRQRKFYRSSAELRNLFDEWVSTLNIDETPS